jgi:membrane peptidoglycan carboxypeptidase
MKTLDAMVTAARPDIPLETLDNRKSAPWLRRNTDKSRVVADVMRKVLICFAGTLVALFLAAAAFIGRVYWDVAKALPDYRLASEMSSWRGCLPTGSKHQFVPLAAIPADTVNAFLAVEDPDFFNRPAFNPAAEFLQALRGMRRLASGLLSGKPRTRRDAPGAAQQGS